MNDDPSPAGLYIVLISVHGLIRANDLELGRDADTGGQTLYVVELAKALAKAPEVAHVDLLTRLVDDPKVSDDYRQPLVDLSQKARIVRLPCGPRRYLRKEVLWRHLDCFADNALRHIRSTGRTPDIIHSHYADAGYVGTRLAGLMDVPLIHTGHSLGRVKRERLRENGSNDQTIEKRYHIAQRIEAEEQTLEAASLVIASTRQEVDEQYAIYDQYRPARMAVIAPGTDLSRFQPPQPKAPYPPIQAAIDRFLETADKPMILAISRPDERKNIASLIDAYGQSPALQSAANLVIIAGNRDNIDSMDKGAKSVLSDLLKRIDRYDLYGKVAYPKHHQPDDVPALYQLATQRQGVFINPALTEPFGLTLIEAAACGVPIVATNDGGPRDIVEHCHNGLLIEPLDIEAIQKALMQILNDATQWQTYSQNGLRGAEQHYAWQSHVQTYLEQAKQLMAQAHASIEPRGQRMNSTDRLLICDIDDTLIGGDKAPLRQLLRKIEQHQTLSGFGIATGRGLNSALHALRDWHVPIPDILITSVGTEIHYGPNMTPDLGWRAHIDHLWERDEIERLFADIPGLRLQPGAEQSEFKLSYDVNAEAFPPLAELRSRLRSNDLHANLIYSRDAYLDVLPLRASKGSAVRYCADKWNIDLDKVLVAGDSGNDADMMTGRTLGVIVANSDESFPQLQALQRVLFATQSHAAGILEAIAHYDFYGKCDVPASGSNSTQTTIEGQVA